MTTVDGFVLIPDRANYAARVRWSRKWFNRSANDLTGGEVRKGFHPEARVALEYRVTAQGSDMARLDSVVRAARTSGRACVPMFGRGGVLTGAALAGSGVLDVSDSWSWRAGDWAFLGDEASHEVLQVTAAALDVGGWSLTLDGVTAEAWPSGAMAWPLLFGEFDLRDEPALSPTMARFELRVTELRPMRAAEVGVPPEDLPGIGEMEVDADFVVT